MLNVLVVGHSRILGIGKMAKVEQCRTTVLLRNMEILRQKSISMGNISVLMASHLSAPP